MEPEHSWHASRPTSPNAQLGVKSLSCLHQVWLGVQLSECLIERGRNRDGESYRILHNHTLFSSHIWKAHTHAHTHKHTHSHTYVMHTCQTKCMGACWVQLTIIRRHMSACLCFIVRSFAAGLVYIGNHGSLFVPQCKPPCLDQCSPTVTVQWAGGGRDIRGKGAGGLTHTLECVCVCAPLVVREGQSRHIAPWPPIMKLFAAMSSESKLIGWSCRAC